MRRQGKLVTDSWVALAQAGLLIRDGLRPALPALDRLARQALDAQGRAGLLEVRESVLRPINTARWALKGR